MKKYLRRNFLMLLTGLFVQTANMYAQNGPCEAFRYDFGMGQENEVPCGPSANTTSSVAINGNGPSAYLNGLLASLPGTCKTGFTDVAPADGAPDQVLWVTFIIQEGGSFEWQTVPGSDDYYYVLFYSSVPYTGTTSIIDNNNYTPYCGSLVQADCGQEFTGWKVESTPDATKSWRFYIAFFLRNGDQVGTGVVKIRKSCGEGCADSDIAVVASPDVCINSGETTSLSATPSGGGGGPYSYTWTPGTGLTPNAFSQVVTTPALTTTTTYTVTAVGADGCPASDTVRVTVGCCDAEAGTITNNGTGPFTICTGQDITSGGTEIIFNKTGHNASLAYVFLLANDLGIVVDYNTTGNFGSIAIVGTYTVYGLSFDETQNGQTVLDFLPGKTIAQIQASTLCLDLVSGAPGNNIINVKSPECGSFN